MCVGTRGRIYSVRPRDASPDAVIDAGLTSRRIEELLARGEDEHKIAQACGHPNGRLRLGRVFVTVREARAVAILMAESDSLCDDEYLADVVARRYYRLVI